MMKSGPTHVAARIRDRSAGALESSSDRWASKQETRWELSRMKYFEGLEQQVSSWPNVSTHPHRFGGREFRFGSAEIGHIHIGGAVDIPFPRSVRDALLAEGLAEEHRWVPNSGWITFHVRGEGDVKHAVWLMRLSYLRYALKIASDPRRALDEYGEELQLSSKLKSLLEPFVPRLAVA